MAQHFFNALRIDNNFFSSKSNLTLAAPARSCRLAPSLWKESDYTNTSAPPPFHLLTKKNFRFLRCLQISENDSFDSRNWLKAIYGVSDGENNC